MATKHMLEKDMFRPSNPWNPDHLVDSSSRTYNQYSYEIRAKFLRFYIQAREEKQTPTYEQKIQFLKAEMPEWKEINMNRQFRRWQLDKRNYLSAAECARYDCVHNDGGAGDGMENDDGASNAPAITDAAIQAISICICDRHFSGRLSAEQVLLI